MKVILLSAIVGYLFTNVSAFGQQSLLGTELLTWTENPAVRNTRLITEFLDKKIEASVGQRAKHWNRKLDDRVTYEKSVEKNRERFRFIISVRDERVPFKSPELVETLDEPALLGETATHKIYKIRWAVFESLNGEGILYEPKSGKPMVTLIAIPDTDNKSLATH